MWSELVSPLMLGNVKINKSSERERTNSSRQNAMIHGEEWPGDMR